MVFVVTLSILLAWEIALNVYQTVEVSLEALTTWTIAALTDFSYAYGCLCWGPTEIFLENQYLK